MRLATARRGSGTGPQGGGPAGRCAGQDRGAAGRCSGLEWPHYRFLERYTVDPTQTGLLNSYQVGTREKIKMTTENPQGAPRIDQGVEETIYSERVATVTKEGQVSELIRRYDKANRKTTLETRPFKTKLLEGLTILYRLQSSVLPQILSLKGRQLRRLEFETIVKQTFLPGLTTVLPRQPVRVGDTWAIPRVAAWALLGSQAAEEGFDLTGEVLSVRKNTQGTSMTALLGVKGQCLVEQGPSGINAVIQFTFEPSPAKAGSGGARPNDAFRGVAGCQGSTGPDRSGEL